MLGYGRDVFAAQTGEQPTLCRRRVGERLEGGKRLGCDDEERRLRIEVVELSDQIDRVDVGDEPDADPGVGVMP